MNDTTTKNSSYCSSSVSSDDLSFSLAVDREIDVFYSTTTDEMPVFEIRLISPHGRTPSPIEMQEDGLSSTNWRAATPTTNDSKPNDKQQTPTKKQYDKSGDFVALRDINAQISPPTEEQRLVNLETIFEGVFLNTPPRWRQHPSPHDRMKENFSPLAYGTKRACIAVGGIFSEARTRNVSEATTARIEPRSPESLK